MTIDNPLVVPVILLALLIGIGLCFFVIFRFVSRFSKPSARSQARTRARSAAPDPAERLAEWAGPAPSTPEPAVAADTLLAEVKSLSGDAVEIFRVLRMGSLGELVVEIDGRRYQKITQIREGTVGRRVLLAIQELEGFVGPHGQKPLPEMHRLTPGAPAATTSVGPSDRDLVLLGQLGSAASADNLPEQRVDLVGYWRKGLGGALRRGSLEGPAEPKSFIHEIEELLQVRLQSQPELASHGIHFRSTALGELRIEVDHVLYDRIDAVPNPGIVTVLKEVIRAWDQT